jgi:hypothetical protein
MKVFKTKGSAILTTIFILFGILAVAMIGLEIIMSGLASRRAQGSSARAFWAAETGIERAAMAFKSFNLNDTLFTSCTDGYLKFCDTADNKCENITGSVACTASKQVYFLANSTEMPGYWVRVKTSGRDVELISRGNFLTTSRQLNVKFCLPTCANKFTNDPDGCGGTCK